MIIFNAWTKAEDATLLKMSQDGFTLDDIAARFPERTREAVRKRVYNLGRRQRIPARIDNEKPWDPPPGMVKRRCLKCEFWFATPEQPQSLCPECRKEPA